MKDEALPGMDGEGPRVMLPGRVGFFRTNMPAPASLGGANDWWATHFLKSGDSSWVDFSLVSVTNTQRGFLPSN